jgi:hypothetical protein
MDSHNLNFPQPGLDETQPLKPPSRPKPRRIRWLVFAVSSVVFAGLIILLALPTLFFPPSELASPYDLFSLAEVSEALDPSRDHLLIALEGNVELYLPEGVDLGEGNLVILPRQDEFVPKRAESEIYREFAVDIFLVRPNGDLINSISFEPAMLICFTLDIQDMNDRLSGIAHYEVQRYEEEGVDSVWVSLDPAPGWREDQACSTLNHLSLYALAIRPILPATETPASKGIEASQTATPTLEADESGLQLYGFPFGTLTP